MSTNPYQPPLIVSEPRPPADPLRGPARGCAVAGVLTLVAVTHGAILAFVLSDASHSKDIAFMTFYSLFALLAFFVAWAMAKRRFRWLVFLSSLLGIALCIPAPLAAVILLRLRRKEVWDSFERSPKNT